jgi:nucleoside-diphosphate-sugar epimerase
MVIAVTGVSGFIGRNVAQHFINQGYEVVGISRSDPNIDELHYIEADLTNEKSLPRLGNALVVHCAAQTHESSFSTTRAINVSGTNNALMLAVDGKFIHISSSSIYNLTSDSCDVYEDEFRYGDYPFYNHYSKTKAEAEILLTQTGSKRTVAPIILRPHGVYGPDDTTVLPRLTNRIRKNNLMLPNGGNVEHSLTHVNNLIHAVECSRKFQFDNVEAFNVSDLTPTTIKDAVSQVIGRSIKVRSVPSSLALQVAKRTSRISEYEIRQIGFNRTYSILKAQNLLGYKPKDFVVDW